MKYVMVLIILLSIIGCDKVKDTSRKFIIWTDEELVDNKPKSNK